MSHCDGRVRGSGEGTCKLGRKVRSGRGSERVNYSSWKDWGKVGSSQGSEPTSCVSVAALSSRCQGVIVAVQSDDGRDS